MSSRGCGTGAPGRPRPRRRRPSVSRRGCARCIWSLGGRPGKQRGLGQSMACSGQGEKTDLDLGGALDRLFKRARHVGVVGLPATPGWPWFAGLGWGSPGADGWDAPLTARWEATRNGVSAQRIGNADRVVICSNGNREGRWRRVVVVAVVGDGHGDGHGRRKLGAGWGLLETCHAGTGLAVRRGTSDRPLIGYPWHPHGAPNQGTRRSKTTSPRLRARLGKARFRRV